MIVFLLVSGFPTVFSQTSTFIQITDKGVIGTEAISRDGNRYIFTETIRKPILIETSDIILDGNGQRMELSTFFEGIKIVGQSGITIQNVKIYTAKVGILLQSTTNCIITNNTISRCSADGIRIKEDSIHNTIKLNTITECEDEGIYVIDGSDNNVIHENRIYKVGNTGIDIEGCGNQIIYGNIFTNNKEGKGVEASGSNNNHIFLNIVTDSMAGIQIKEDCSNNLIYKNI